MVRMAVVTLSGVALRYHDRVKIERIGVQVSVAVQAAVRHAIP